ncbi:MAG: GxxExxY protein [Patescibacteria group bacterium]
MEKFFLEKELGYRLMGCFFKVRNLYGVGHREIFYYKALDDVLKEEKLDFVNKPHISIYSLQTGKKISFIVPDKLVQNKIIVEIKAKPFCNLDDINQTREYLKITEFEIVYLVNFGEKNFRPKRYIYTNDNKSFLAQMKHL